MYFPDTLKQCARCRSYRNVDLPVCRITRYMLRSIFELVH